MKKNLFVSIFVLFFSVFISAQSKNTVELSDDIYKILQISETKGLCSLLSPIKPYSQKYIFEKVTEILSNLDNCDSSKYVTDVEKQILLDYKDRYGKEQKAGFDLNLFTYTIKEKEDNKLFTVSGKNYEEGFVSGGVYSNPDLNSWGYEVMDHISFFGDMASLLSYRIFGVLEATCMPLYQLGDDYYIGNWWKETDFKEKKDSPLDENWYYRTRTINTFRNYSVLPYSYKKQWGGSVYHFNNMSGSHLEGWPTTDSLSFALWGEMNFSFLNDRIILNIARVNREWAAMDEGSSLVLNKNAQGFFGFSYDLKLSKNFNLTSLLGNLEFPNERFINWNAWYLIGTQYDKDGNLIENTKLDRQDPGIKDSNFFQNMFGIAMVSGNFKYLYADFGSTVILPKRIEPAYGFSFLESTIYQNSIGDFDNMALFGDLKIKLPGIGSVWASAFIDECFYFNNFFTKTRDNFAIQAGTKAVLPFLPFATVSFRYTKVEPYCYTHPAVSNTPWYANYISTSYTNNGAGLGYYLKPNSDEFFLRFDSMIKSNMSLGLQYQLIRHGTDWGSGQVEGSNYYSELAPANKVREQKRKYFLYDGTYEWQNIIAVDFACNFNNFNVPVRCTLTAGYLIDWFTGVEKNGEKNSSFSIIHSDEYPEANGFVFALNVNIFY